MGLQNMEGICIKSKFNGYLTQFVVELIKMGKIYIKILIILNLTYKPMKSSHIAQRLNLQQLLISLKGLNQEFDQSYEENLQLQFLDDIPQSTPKDCYHSQQKLDDICRKEAHSHWSVGINQVSERGEVQKMGEMNRKLFQDNQVLLHQCIRLRKLLKNEKYHIQNQCVQKLQLENIDSKNQINILKVQNLQLRLGLPNNSQFTIISNSKVLEILKSVKEDSEKLTRRIQDLSYQVRGIKLSHSNTTTLTSRTLEKDSQKAMFNIQNVYQKKIGRLEIIIKQQSEQLARFKKSISPSGMMQRAWER